MSRYRLYPTPAQEAILREYCAHARFAWNLCVEQQSWWRPGRKAAPNWAQRSRQLTEARAEFEWLRAVPRVVQEMALRDFEQALQWFFAGTHGKPTWRKARLDEGFRIRGEVGGPHSAWDVRRINRRWGHVKIPKIGWVRFRWSRAVPAAKSYRVTLDRAGRWHVAFAAIPKPLSGPGTGEVVGIDRGVVVTLALSNGETLQAPGPAAGIKLLSRRLARAKRGSTRRHDARVRLARATARDTDRRKDWAEKASTDVARRFDVIRIEDLKIQNMTRSARGSVEEPGRNVRAKTRLNRGILRSGWGLFADRLEDKAPGRVEKIRPRFTSMICYACGHCEEGNRKSQAFLCLRCGHRDHADVNAAKNIAAGHAVTARGGFRVAGPLNREPLAGAA